jgi:proteasome lid subunit RPN8/RPN11
MKAPAHILQAAITHAQACAPNESCGVVVSLAGVYTYYPVRNINARPTHDVDPHPDDMADAEDLGLPVLLVHSHVLSGPQPSIADRSACEDTGLPWLIVTPSGAHSVIEPCGYRAPLEGRPYRYGIHDCATLCRDWYEQELGVKFEIPASKEAWWQRGESLFLDHLPRHFFSPVPAEAMQRGDLVLMHLEGAIPHHAGIYLGDGTVLHQMRDRVSRRDVYGHSLRIRTHSIWRPAACQ